MYQYDVMFLMAVGIPRGVVIYGIISMIDMISLVNTASHAL